MIEITSPQLPSEPTSPSNPLLLHEAEEVTDAVFRGADFMTLCREHLSIQSGRFTGCHFAGASLLRSQWSDVLFRNCDFSNADLSGCSFHRVQFVDCKLSGTNLSETTGHHLLLERCKGEYLNFSFSRFRTARFSDSRLRGSIFSDCCFERSEFTVCDLSQAEFFGTRLCGLSFSDSEIHGIRVREIGSLELKGLKINALQAAELVRLLGVEIER